MPRPPILPEINWEMIFHAADIYEGWLKRGESPENQDMMESARSSVAVPNEVKEALDNLDRTVYVVAFAEDWCGDVVRHVPILQYMADTCRYIEVRYLHREDSPDTFVRFLTNGGEAIPKFIFLNEQFVECANWGPMPDKCRELIARGKACGDVSAARKLVKAEYEADPECRQVAMELCRCIDIAASTSPDPSEGLLRAREHAQAGG